MTTSAAAVSDSPHEDTSHSPDGLPPYAAEFRAFHAAFEPELRDVVARLPLRAGMRVVDVGCGDGFYTGLLAARLAVAAAADGQATNDRAVGDRAAGEVTAVDNNPNFLRAAERRIRERGDALAPVRFVHQDLDGLAAAPPSYDLAWCAQSLYSFPEPVAALKKIAAALKPGGIVVVLENDTLHQLLLPWPTELELVVRAAEFAALAAESNRPGKYYVGRRLPAVFAEAGLEPLGFVTQAIDRAAPLDKPLESFLNHYLQRVRERIGPHVAERDAAEFADYVAPDGARYLLRRPHFTCTWINVVAWGRKPD